MDDILFETLLHGAESESLDFKRDQYRFVGANDEEKSELLKDILGFANSWKRTTAYILIGVEEVRGGRSSVYGINPEDHLEDNYLQQFVNTKTNRPVRFGYEAFQYEGKHVGVISIGAQDRPIYLKRKYGKLDKGAVYLRLGSSTNTQNPASPDEIAKMGREHYKPQGRIHVSFADSYDDNSLGGVIHFQKEHLKARESIPDYEPERSKGPFSMAGIWRDNKEFFREAVEYYHQQGLYHALRLEISNSGETTAENVRLEITISPDTGVRFLNSLADWPESQITMYQGNTLSELLPQIGDKSVEYTRDSSKVTLGIDLGIIQPGRKVYSNVFYLGFVKTGEYEFSGFLYADNLSKPLEFKLGVNATVSQGEIDMKELERLVYEKYLSEVED